MILDEDHYGLEKVKERILEYLAVRSLADTIRSPILLFVGPPGVGKTSLGKSIARAMGRKFTRMSLGGIHDEAEIRGHRRTYIGALPGRIIQSIKTAGTNNPVFMLDEVDKIGMDFRGDPSSALLEVLDPEQNFSFQDNYLEVPFDLRKVLFVATANLLEPIPAALRDRMEVIALPGYTQQEKVQIARRFLVPKQMENHGLKAKHVEITDEVLTELVQAYTHEAGVRNLERELASVMRKVARSVAEGRKRKTVVDLKKLEEYLGPPRFEYGELEAEDQTGSAIGLVVTEVGGDVVAVEVTLMEGKEDFILTGQLGDVMRESARAALSWIRSNARELGIAREVFEKHTLHIHVPAGATPKDGPSAGVTMATAMVSALTGIPVRKDVAMTGEITLRGRVLPIGGLKSKILAAHLAGAGMVILPRKNEKDLRDIPEEIRKQIKLVLADNMEQVLEAALRRARSRSRPCRRRSSRAAASCPSRSAGVAGPAHHLPAGRPAAGGGGEPLGHPGSRGEPVRTTGRSLAGWGDGRWSTATTTRSSGCPGRPARPTSRRRSGSSRVPTTPIGTPATRPPRSGSRTSTRQTPSSRTRTSASSTTCSAPTGTSTSARAPAAAAARTRSRPAGRSPASAGSGHGAARVRPAARLAASGTSSGRRAAPVIAGFSDFFRMFFSGAAAGAPGAGGGEGRSRRAEDREPPGGERPSRAGARGTHRPVARGGLPRDHPPGRGGGQALRGPAAARRGHGQPRPAERQGPQRPRRRRGRPRAPPRDLPAAGRGPRARAPHHAARGAAGGGGAGPDAQGTDPAHHPCRDPDGPDVPPDGPGHAEAEGRRHRRSVREGARGAARDDERRRQGRREDVPGPRRPARSPIHHLTPN